MFKPLTLIIAFLGYLLSSSAQIGIGTTSPHTSAIVEVNSSNKGFLPPRLTAFERISIQSPALGLMVYCTNCCQNGRLSLFNGTKWSNINPCPEIDFDDDGIINEIDLDDDNDGILDIDEFGENSIEFSSGSLDGSQNPQPLVRFNAHSVTQFNPAEAITDIKTVDTGIDFFVNGESIVEGIQYIEVSGEAKPTNISSCYLTTDGISLPNGSGSNPNYVRTPYYPNTAAPDLPRVRIIIRNNQEVEIYGTLTTTSTTLTRLYPTVNAQLKTFTFLPGDNTFSIVNRDGRGIDGIEATNKVFYTKDFDNDNIPNSQDTDSDNDGCSDAREAGLTNNTNSNSFNFSNLFVGENGIADDLETSPDSGILKSPTETTSDHLDQNDKVCL